MLAPTTEKGTLTITKLLCMHCYTEALDAPTYDPHHYIYINNWNDRCYWENYYNTHSTYIMIHSKGHSSLQFMFEALWTTICPSPALPCSTLPSQPARQPSNQPQPSLPEISSTNVYYTTYLTLHSIHIHWTLCFYYSPSNQIEYYYHVQNSYFFVLYFVFRNQIYR